MKLTRNDSCWCGSGLKYKKCHLEMDQRLEELEKKGYIIPPRNIIRTDEQVAGIRRACQLSKDILDKLEEIIAPGITTDYINTWVHEYTIAHGAIPAPLDYNGYPKSICTSLNEVICHGIPGPRVLQDGDIMNVDVTCILDGYYGDTSRMYLIGDPSAEARQLVRVARECMYLGIEQVRPYNRVGDIAFAIEQHARKFGYSVVQDYGGHGVGLKFHEEPFVQHYGDKDCGMVLVPNMVFTVEPMINAGTYKCRVLDDNWTAVTLDGSLSAQWEHTVCVTESGFEILSE
jgi:methionyl aminopeptidase